MTVPEPEPNRTVPVTESVTETETESGTGTGSDTVPSPAPFRPGTTKENTMGFATDCINAGQEPDTTTGAVTVPI